MGPPLLTPFDLARITLRISAVIIDIWAQDQRLIDPSKLAHFSSRGWGLIDLPLRVIFSPPHPLARRDVPLTRARSFRDRALREHRRSSGPIPFPR